MNCECWPPENPALREELCQKLLKHSQDAIAVIEVETRRLLYYNPWALGLKDRRESEAGRCFETLRGKDAPCKDCPFNGKSESEPETVFSQNGRHFRRSIVPLEWEGRKAVLEIISDITKQVELEFSLAREQEKIKLVEESSDAFLWDYDPVQRVSSQTEVTAERYAVPRKMENMPEGAIRMGLISADTQRQYKELYRQIHLGAPEAEAQVRILNKRGERHWFRLRMKSLRDSEGNPLYAAGLGVDVTPRETSAKEALALEWEPMEKAILERIMEDDYDYLLLVDILSNTCYQFSIGQDSEPILKETHPDYDALMRSVNRSNVVAEEVELAIHDLSREIMAENLSRAKAFTGMYHFRGPGGEIRTKKIRYTWLDQAVGYVMVTRSDVTEKMEDDKRQQDLLKSALAQAEQASNAKTDFLSKMSHEIRTPMNAIIGMNALAAQNLYDPQQVADCIAKVGISARYLLSLINDILDMSRIESGKLNLRSELIPLEEFINGVNNLIYEQATDKGLSYDSIVTGFVAQTYVGDAMKLQQILINLLGNAVKFTPKGGKVQLIVHQDRIEHDRAWMRFTVNDTGMGISEEFQKRMFQPFEQEHGGVTYLYGGTGLGLAITKNLVQLMGGSITVSSIVGVGSEFMVTVPLGIAPKQANDELHSELHLEKMSALVVDDEILICQQVEALLLEVGMKAEWVDSGYKAVQTVKSRWAAQKYFDIILIDWKMPDMDGIETARQIREIVGPDVTIIIITAYEWAEIEREAKAAGVNLLVTKPLFKTSLISTFEKAFCSRPGVKNPATPTVEYDFTGYRALLVEDHLLNIEVAKRLLQVKGMEVEVAENGVVALEAFASAPPRYYDVILMDIQMPLMDGLTATRSIRVMKKETSKTIPIIAMSANAFDDDVDKSRLAGMNAHLSKPIEPQLLYETVFRFLRKEEEK